MAYTSNSAAFSSAAGEQLPELDIDPPQRQRRLTVLLRLLLLIPQYIVLFFLGIVAFFVAIIGWFAALVLGQLPPWAENFLAGYVGYATRVSASEWLLVDRYPPFSFSAPGYPVQIELHPGPLNRLAVLLRIILVIPAAIISSVITTGWGVCSFFIWLIVLILGRMPEPLFEASAAIMRYAMRLQAYWFMLTPAYPKRLFGDGTPVSSRGWAPGQAGASATRPLLMTTGARVLLVVFIVLGVLGGVSDVIAGGSGTTTSNDGSAGVSTHAHQH
jgi:Domain of unknown function (DUF4389)